MSVYSAGPSWSGPSSGQSAVWNGGTGFAAASMNSSTGSPPFALAAMRCSRCMWCNPCTGSSPTQIWASAVNDGATPEPPMSMRATTCSPAHSSGTTPRMRNHVVSHRPPHWLPTVNGSNARWYASAGAMGSPCTWWAATSSGVRRG